MSLALTPTSVIAAAALLALVALIILAETANLTADEPFYPSGHHRERLLFAVLACALSFAAGAVL